MTITAWIVGAINAAAAVWVLWVARKGKPAAPRATPPQWRHYKKQPLVRDRPDYIKQRIAAYERARRGNV